MKKAFLKRLLIVFSAALFSIYGTIYACGGGDWDWDWFYETNFTPETFVDKAYAPLFLSEQLFYGNEALGDYKKFNDVIAADWAAYLGKSMKPEDVSFFLLDSSATDVNDIYNYIKNKKETPLTAKWAKQMKFKDKKIKSFITFLYYAKQIETASVTTDYWNYESTQYQAFDNEKTLLEIENIYKNTPDVFLKSRWWFQTVKAYFYSVRKDKAIAFFERTENSVPKDLLYYRALSYIAGIQHKSKNFGVANYNYSRVFDHCPQMRDIAWYSFHPQEQKDWEQSLALAKNADEQAALWAIQGYYTDEEQAIAAIYKIKPQSEYLDFLLTRLVNRQELRVNLSFDRKASTQNGQSVSDTISTTAVALVNTIAHSGKTAKPYLWSIAAGYLETLSGHFSKAESYFASANTQMPKTELAQNQLRLLRFVNNLSSMDAINAQQEAKILDDLKWLYVELPQKERTIFRYQHASDWSKQYLSALYKKQKNPVMAELFARQADFYDKPQNLVMMKSFLLKNSKSDFENIAAGIYEIGLDDIYKYESVIATFKNKIPEAIAFMELANNSKDQVFLGNPFNGNIKDCHDCDHQIIQKRAYSFIVFLQTISEMQEKLNKSEDIYTNSLLLGNAFYNISHYGNGRTFHEGIIFGYATTPLDFKENSRALATDASVAKKYYEMAFAAAKNDEQRAKCQYMIAKCERNSYYNSRYEAAKNWWEVEDGKLNFLAWNGFKALKNRYPKTQYFQEVLAECGYFKTYIDQQKK